MKKIAIVGFNSTTRHLAPYDNPDYEIWGLNEGYLGPWMKRWDRWFQIHKRETFTNNRHDPHHLEWLQAQRGFPIYMQQHWDDIPASVAYPIEEAKAYSMVDEGYFAGTTPYMLALAVMMGFKHVEFYGVDLLLREPYAYIRPNFEYHVGLARARGVRVVFPEGCLITQEPLYGWEVERD